MPVFVGLLRAVNVGRTGRVSMGELVDLCEGAGLAGTRTVGASGNLVFDHAGPEPAARAALDAALRPRLGPAARALVRPPTELARLLAANPFGDADPACVHVLFADEPIDPARATGLGTERLHPDGRALFIHYPDGAGRSRLRHPAQAVGTARNLSAIARILAAAAPPGRT